jgi:hypothetical protein
MSTASPERAADSRHDGNVSAAEIARFNTLAAREMVDIDTAAILAKTRAWRERIAAA